MSKSASPSTANGPTAWDSAGHMMGITVCTLQPSFAILMHVQKLACSVLEQAWREA